MSIIDVPLLGSYEEVARSAVSANATEVLDQVRAIRKDSGEADAQLHNGLLDVAFRDVLADLVVSTDIETSDAHEIWTLLDSLNLLSDNDLCDVSLAFWLIEDMLDSQTTDGCKKIFDYMLSRRESMTRKSFKTKQLVILRCCNELLRRVSRAEDAVFCGQVFIYLFECFPLGDKSSVNLRAEYHVENVTTYDEHLPDEHVKPMDLDTQPNLAISRAQTPTSSRASPAPKTIPVPTLQELYPVFWSLQNIFSSPLKLMENAETIQHFRDSFSKTLVYFKHVSNVSVSASSTRTKRGVKRKWEDMPDNDSLPVSSFNPKYLTSRDLFNLELQDIEFRRNILVQMLIMLDFLLSWSASNKPKFHPEGKAKKSKVNNFILAEADEKWAVTTRKDIESYLASGPDGRHYLRMVNMVLSRDKNWAYWKLQGCPAISREPVEVEYTVKAQDDLQRLSQEVNAALGIPNGASELKFLSKNNPLESLKHRDNEVPSMDQYYKDIQNVDLDMDFATTEEEKNELEERKAGNLWRALRSAKGRRFALCEEIRNGENLGALIGRKEEPNEHEVSDQNGVREEEVEADGVGDADVTKDTDQATAETEVKAGAMEES